jgi:hypothetical protein
VIRVLGFEVLHIFLVEVGAACFVDIVFILQAVCLEVELLKFGGAAP